jgi:hypothetical protein
MTTSSKMTLVLALALVGASTFCNPAPATAKHHHHKRVPVKVHRNGATIETYGANSPVYVGRVRPGSNLHVTTHGDASPAFVGSTIKGGVTIHYH